jgi:fatty-acyl-CoA synthase
VPVRASYASGVSDVSLVGETIGDNFDRTVARCGEREALVDCPSGRRWTYAQLRAEVDAMAHGLLAAGIGKGDRVGIWAPNCPEWLFTQYATAKIGAILVTINPAYRTSELEYVLTAAGIRLLIAAESFKTSDYAAMIAQARPRCTTLERVVLIGSPEWDALLVRGGAAALLARTQATLSPDDPINIQYTSGTTGFPKGATLSHHNILNNGYFVGELCGYTEVDRICLPVPLYHWVNSTDLSSLRTGIMAGSPCPVEVMKQVVERMGMTEVTICYGMTETSPVSTQTRADDTLDRRVSTVGRVHPHLEVKIIDPDTGLTVPRGTPGELCTRGYSVMLGYWEQPDKTAEVIDQARWMHTGDVAVMDPEGYLTITGRIKDMVIRGGENVYPREVEEFLYTHPDILDAQVIGVPDARYGEELCAWVRLRPGAPELTAEALRDYAAGTLAGYKIPRYVHVVEEFPMTVTGKVRKVEMRERSVTLLGLGDVAATKYA